MGILDELQILTRKRKRTGLSKLIAISKTVAQRISTRDEREVKKLHTDILKAEKQIKLMQVKQQLQAQKREIEEMRKAGILPPTTAEKLKTQIIKLPSEIKSLREKVQQKISRRDMQKKGVEALAM